MADFDALDVRDLVERTPLMTRILVRVFRRRLNRDVFSPLVNRAYERGVISSHQLHVIHHQMDPTQRGFVGQL